MKVLANRLKPLMPKLTSSCQSSFVEGRQAADNIIILQEIVHTLQKQKGRRGAIVAKIDLEKAYDKIEWAFLQQVLLTVGFSSHITKLVMYCITSAKLAVLWNENILPKFLPTRGLRQGDPLSPYLFILCMETLAHRIQQATATRGWKPVQVCRGGSVVSHIFFANDLLLMGEATDQQALVMDTILLEFCQESGQRVNRRKSKIWFSPNTDRVAMRRLSNLINMPITQNLGIYLGIPIHHGRIQKLDYEYLIAKVRKKLEGWKCWYLSGEHKLCLSEQLQKPSLDMPCRLPSYLEVSLRSLRK